LYVVGSQIDLAAHSIPFVQLLELSKSIGNKLSDNNKGLRIPFLIFPLKGAIELFRNLLLVLTKIAQLGTVPQGKILFHGVAQPD
jgi:hypothetical protein